MKVKRIYNVEENIDFTLPAVENFSENDRELLDVFTLNSFFDSNKHKVELHIYDFTQTLVSSIDNYRNFKIAQETSSAGKPGASLLTINPVSDVEELYDFGVDTRLVYNFLNNVFSVDASNVTFYIEEISPDRTEVKLNTLDIPEEQVRLRAAEVKSLLDSQSYFSNLHLNFSQNIFSVILNLDIFEENGIPKVILKLYEPLPVVADLKSVVTVDEIVADSYTVDVSVTIETELEPPVSLKAPNFNLDVIDNTTVPTEYLDYDKLLSYPVSNTNNEIFSAINTQEISVNVDYSDYSSFIYFSSAEERLLNFKYKLDLITYYNSVITDLTNVGSSTVSYQNLVKGIISNFDHYEKYLYFESGSDAWPKTNSVRPFSNDISSATGSWFTSKLEDSIYYDNTNINTLIESVPVYLREDPNNENYLTFIHMIGQHFDNLWIYAKAVTDKYDRDNRLLKGISKDLVGTVLQNFGVNLYTSGKSVENFYNSIITQEYSNTGEDINYYITGSISGSSTPVEKLSYDSYSKSIYKRIYHNLPLLLKSKGTERGLRALINCFGIPSDILKIKLYGGVKVDGETILSDSAFVTSSLGKIRLDNQGTTLPENTLSTLTRTHKSGQEYTKDSHVIEVGFSPVDDVDNYIKGELAPGFDLDDYLGDPRNLYRTSYDLLLPSGEVEQSMQVFLENLLQNLDGFHLKDYVRLIKFFDNTLFKMIKDFIPARATSNVGVIIKPHALDRSKIKFTQADVTFHHYSASIEIEGPTATHGSTFGARDQFSTSYDKSIQSPEGITVSNTHRYQIPKYNGELSSSFIDTTDGNLIKNNPYSIETYTSYVVSSSLISDFPVNICLLSPGLLTRTVTGRSTDSLDNPATRNIALDFGTTRNIVFVTGSTDITSTANAYVFRNPPVNYASYIITASNSVIEGCSGSIQYDIRYCDLQASSTTRPFNLVQGIFDSYDLTTWIDAGTNENLTYTITYNGNTSTINTPTDYVLPPADANIGTFITLSMEDPVVNAIYDCKVSFPIQILQSLYDCNFLQLIRGSVRIVQYNERFEQIVPTGTEDLLVTIVYSYIPFNGGYGGQRVEKTTTITEEGPFNITVDEQIADGTLELSYINQSGPAGEYEVFVSFFPTVYGTCP